jgi:methylmalonyl-CoA/ethylmalonyl-CoA epimerase
MPALQRLGQIAFAVADVAEATRLFRDVLGIPFLFSPYPGLAFFDLWGVRLMVAALEDGQEAGRNCVLYFQVPSVNDTFAELKTQLNFIDEPHLIAKMPDHELWMVFFRDAENNLLGFMEERR